MCGDVRKSGLAPDERILTPIMSTHFKAGNVKAALDVYGEILGAGFEPDVVTHSALMDGLCKNGHLHDAVKYICVEKANEVLYTVLIDGTCKGGKLGEVFRVFREMTDAGLCKEGNLAKAFRLRNKMIKEGIEPNLFTFSSLIFGLAHKGLTVEAKQVFDNMLWVGIEPDYVVYDILIKGYLKEDNMVCNFRLA